MLYRLTEDLGAAKLSSGAASRVLHGMNEALAAKRGWRPARPAIRRSRWLPPGQARRSGGGDLQEVAIPIIGQPILFPTSGGGSDSSVQSVTSQSDDSDFDRLPGFGALHCSAPLAWDRRFGVLWVRYVFAQIVDARWRVPSEGPASSDPSAQLVRGRSPTEAPVRGRDNALPTRNSGLRIRRGRGVLRAGFAPGR